MVYSESRSPRGKSAHPEFYTNPTFSVGPNDALNTYNSAYRSDAIPTISGSCSFGYALQHLAPGASGLPYQPMTPTLDYSGFVEPNNQWPTLDSAQFYSGGYQDTPGHSTYHAPILPIQPSGRQGATWTWGALSTGTTFRLGLQSIRPGILGIPNPPGPSPSPSPTSLSSPSPLSPAPLALSGAADARPFPCSGCPSSFKHRKDLKRHMTSVHTTGNERVYRCRCGFQGVRKDNYLRHVSRCNEEPCYPEYSCKCEDACADKEMHSEHVRLCRHGFGNIGRPRAF